MPIGLRIPNINGKTDKAQLSEIRSYLYQLVPELQWALNTMEMQYAAQKDEASPGLSSDVSATFHSMKSMIMQSVDIINAYYAEIKKRIDGDYVMQSNFSDAFEKTRSNILEYAKELDTLSHLLQTMKQHEETILYEMENLQAYLRFGLLEDGDIPLFGLEIGQRIHIEDEVKFRKWMRFTPDKVSLYDGNDKEVACIRDRRFFIRNMEITERRKLGGLMDIVTSNGDIITKWVGGE